MISQSWCPQSIYLSLNQCTIFIERHWSTIRNNVGNEPTSWTISGTEQRSQPTEAVFWYGQMSLWHYTILTSHQKSYVISQLRQLIASFGTNKKPLRASVWTRPETHLLNASLNLGLSYYVGTWFWTVTEHNTATEAHLQKQLETRHRAVQHFSCAMLYMALRWRLVPFRFLNPYLSVQLG